MSLVVLGEYLSLCGPEIDLEWDFLCCGWSRFCFGGDCGLVAFLVRYVECSFFFMHFMLDLVRAVMYPRRRMFYCGVPGPHY